MAGQAADAMTTLALAQVVMFEIEQGASPAALTRALLTATVPIAVAGPLAGLAADRWRRNSTLVAASAARAALTLVALMVPATGNALLGYVLGAALLTMARVLYTARVASTPHTVDRSDLVAADSLGMLAGTAAGGIGAALGLALMVGSPAMALAGAAVLHLVSAAGFASLGLDLGGGRLDGPRTGAAEPGILRTITSGPVGGAVAVTGGHRLLVGAAFSTFVLLAGARYRLESSGYAGALAVVAMGSGVGTAIAPSTARRLSRRQVAVAAYVVAGLALWTASVVDSSPIVVGAMMLVANAFQNVRLSADALIQATVDDGLLGRVFTVHDVVSNLSFTTGALLVTVLSPHPTAAPFAAIGAAFCVVAGLIVVSSRPSTTKRTRP